MSLLFFSGSDQDQDQGQGQDRDQFQHQFQHQYQHHHQHQHQHQHHYQARRGQQYLALKWVGSGLGMHLSYAHESHMSYFVCRDSHVAFRA